MRDVIKIEGSMIYQIERKKDPQQNMPQHQGPKQAGDETEGKDGRRQAPSLTSCGAKRWSWERSVTVT